MRAQRYQMTVIKKKILMRFRRNHLFGRNPERESHCKRCQDAVIINDIFL